MSPSLVLILCRHDDSHAKLVLDVKTYAGTQAQGGCQFYDLATEAFWGEPGRLPGRAKPGLREQGMETGVVYYD